MTHKKPQPLNSRSEPGLCPVCGKVSYSAAGIHPQCAVTQADASRKNRLENSKRARKLTKSKKILNRWQKTCPKCKASQHVRKKICDCGHAFDVKPAASNGDDKRS